MHYTQQHFDGTEELSK